MKNMLEGRLWSGNQNKEERNEMENCSETLLGTDISKQKRMRHS